MSLHLPPIFAHILINEYNVHFSEVKELFTIQLKAEEVEATTTISSPEVTRQGAIRNIVLQSIESIHLFSIAYTDGALKRKKIFLPEYLDKFFNKENFESAKLYHLKIPGGFMSMVQF